MRGFAALLVGLEISAAALLSAPAQAASGAEASPTGKGIAGGALLGAEAVMLTEAAVGVRPAWAYIVGGGVGAIGGGVGGYFVEGSSVELPFYMLLGGMALALPTTVAVLSTTAYEPVNYTEDNPPADEPVADPAAPVASPPPIEKPTGRHDTPQKRNDQRARAVLPAAPPAIIGLGDGALSFAVPAVEVRHVYTRTEIATFGVKDATEIRVPVLNVVF